MKIGFFGDSFCSDLTDRPDRNSGYETYINKLKKHYNAEIVNLGVAGSSIYDSILLQIKPFIDKNEHPDICIFVWTNYGRIFHRSVRNMMPGTLPRLLRDSKANKTPIISAAIEYYAHLLDWELHEYQYKSALHYFDLNILSNFPKTTKVLHLWAFENEYSWKNGTLVLIPNYKYLMALAADGRKVPSGDIDPELNHLDGEHKNILVFETIKTAIDNYEYSLC
jgi:hypothetical protein